MIVELTPSAQIDLSEAAVAYEIHAAFFIVFEDRARVFAVLHQHRQPEAWVARKRT